MLQVELFKTTAQGETFTLYTSGGVTSLMTMKFVLQISHSSDFTHANIVFVQSDKIDASISTSIVSQVE